MQRSAGRQRERDQRQQRRGSNDRCRLQRHIVGEVDTPADLVDMVVHGVGISLLPPAAIRMATGRVVGLVTSALP